jgi:hypothetical protein
MKKILLIAAGLIAATALSVNAQDTPKKALTPEQKQLKTEMTTKYDTNKDGKLDKEERAKISAEDKEKMDKAGLTPKKKKAQ